MRRRRRSALGWLILGAVVVPAVVWTTGLEPTQLLLVVGIGAATVAVLRFRASAVTIDWPEPVVLTPDRGVRREVARLSWAVGRGGDSQVGSTSVRRLQGVARRRLGRCGVNLDDPSAAVRGAALVGSGPWHVLSTAPGTTTISPAAFRAAVIAVERLSDPAIPTPAGER